MSGWHRDPATVEMVVHQALMAGDMRGAVMAMRLLASIDPQRAEAMLNVIEIGIELNRVSGNGEVP